MPLRIARACREAGIESVAVYSDADAASPHVRAADRAVCIGPAAPSESYLSIPALLAAARSTGADAVHPGYGFLSENARFARACESAGLIFIGPPADVIEQMGSKIGARELMQRAGVPVVPGETPRRSDRTRGCSRRSAASAIPRSSRHRPAAAARACASCAATRRLADMIPAARREATAAFGDGTLYVERLIERPRHVEIQVFGDAHGTRRAPLRARMFHSAAPSEDRRGEPLAGADTRVRAAMGEAAVAAARAAGYRNAGTIEFLLEGSGDEARFYFLEMNTRLQVEHPVTEAVTGLDLVRAQIAVAEGHPLPWAQADLSQRGHAIECRVYAEDPANGFLPQAGSLLLYREPRGPGLRIDAGVVEGGDVSVHYDPLLAKLVVFAETREAAIDRAAAALRTYPILGIRTNIPFLLRLLKHPEFRAGRVHTGFIDAHLQDLLAPSDAPAEALAAAAIATPAASGVPRGAGEATTPDPWATLTGWGR